MEHSPGKQFQICTERLPERCDICHQADLFDQESGICNRCKTIQPVPVIHLDPHSPTLSPRIHRILATELASGEHLLWVGKPGSWSKEQLKAILVLVVFTVGVTILIEPRQFVFQGVFLFLGLALFYDFWLRTRIIYALTNRRVFICQEGLLQKRLRSYFRRTLKIVHIAKDSPKAGSIYFEETAFPTKNGESYIRTGFENIADYEKVEHLIRTQLLYETQAWKKTGGLS